MIQTKRIAAVIVTYNRLNILEKCIQALRKQSLTYSQLIVINNNSSDGTTEWLEGQPDIYVINKLNDGSAGGFYAGVKYAFEQGFDYIWLMDDDVIVNNKALEELMVAKEIIRDFSFLCSKVISIDGIFMNSPHIDTATSKYNYPVWGQYSEHSITGIKAATFVSLFINAAYISKAGLPQRKFFIWGDDIDFTIRLRKVAPAWMVGKSIVTHLRANPSLPQISTETDEKRIAMHFYNVRNNLYIIRRERGIISFLWNALRFKIAALSFLLQKKGFLKSGIYIKGICAALFFNPQIEYPFRS